MEDQGSQSQKDSSPLRQSDRVNGQKEKKSVETEVFNGRQSVAGNIHMYDQDQGTVSGDYDGSVDGEWLFDFYNEDDEEEEDENSPMEEENTDVEYDELDPDEMSYEELIALGDIIGKESRGLQLQEIPSCLTPRPWCSVERKGGVDTCVICLVDFEEGGVVQALTCDHPFHGDCIIEWLMVRRTCPICTVEILPPQFPSPPK